MQNRDFEILNNQAVRNLITPHDRQSEIVDNQNTVIAELRRQTSNQQTQIVELKQQTANQQIQIAELKENNLKFQKQIDFAKQEAVTSKKAKHNCAHNCHSQYYC